MTASNPALPLDRLQISKDFHSIMQGWLDKLAALLVEGNPLSIMHQLMEMGVDDPEHCACEGMGLWTPAANELMMLMEEIHSCHRVYNRMIWEMLVSIPGLMPRLRVLLQEDLNVLAMTEEEDRKEFLSLLCEGETEDDFVYDPWGNITSHHHAKGLLASFLWLDESLCDWI